MKKNLIYLIILLLIVSCLASFGRMAGNDFINFDDDIFITENIHVQSGFNKEDIRWAFTTVHHSYWHPLTWLSHMLDWSLFGNNATGHHLVSLFLHIGSAILLFLFCYKQQIISGPRLLPRLSSPCTPQSRIGRLGSRTKRRLKHVLCHGYPLRVCFLC